MTLSCFFLDACDVKSSFSIPLTMTCHDYSTKYFYCLVIGFLNRKCVLRFCCWKVYILDLISLTQITINIINLKIMKITLNTITCVLLMACFPNIWRFSVRVAKYAPNWCEMQLNILINEKLRMVCGIIKVGFFTYLDLLNALYIYLTLLLRISFRYYLGYSACI